MATTDVAQAILATAPDELPFGVGTVTGINGDGTLQILFRTATLDHMHRLASYASPAVNDVVLLLHGGGQAMVLGAIV